MGAIAARRNRCHSAAVKCALEGNQPGAFRGVLIIVKFACGFDGAFHRFSAGICEKDAIGKAQCGQSGAKFFLLHDAIQIGRMPKFLRLARKSSDETGIGMTQNVDGNSAGEIEIFFTVLGDQIGSFAALEQGFRAIIGKKQRVRVDLAHDPEPWKIATRLQSF